MTKAFDLERFLVDVFDPVAGEKAAVMTDLPTAACPDNQAWRDRRAMAAEWRGGLEQLGYRIGFDVLPLVTYAATGANNADLPAEAEVGGKRVPLASVLDEVSLVLALILGAVRFVRARRATSPPTARQSTTDPGRPR